MALIISFVNQSGLAPKSNYKVDVWVNNTHIAGPFEVKDHIRDDGWLELLKQFVDERSKKGEDYGRRSNSQKGTKAKV